MKNCTPLWCEAHFEVKMLKTPGVRTTFGRWDVVPRGRCKGLWILLKVSKTLRFCSIFNHNHHYTPIHYTTLQLQLHWHLHYIPLHYTTLHYTKLHYTTLHYTTLHPTTLHYTTLHYITLHYTPQHYNYNYTTTLHYTKLHDTTLHYPTLHYVPLHSTTLHYITLRYITLNDTAPQIDR